MISRSQMNRQLYADGMVPDVTQEVRSVLQGIRSLDGMVPNEVRSALQGIRSLLTPKYMLPLDKLQEIADAQGVSIKEANDMVKRWAMGTGDPKGLEKLFIPKMSRETQDVPEYYDRRLQILDPEQMRQEIEDPSMPNQFMPPRTDRAGGGIMNVAREKYGIGSSIKKFVRKIIPNEVADIAVAAAPFVAPFNPALAAGMSALGTFDQTGRIGQSLKSGALNYAGGQVARGIGGGLENLQGNPFGGGPIFTSPTTGNAITMDSLSNIFSAQEPFVGDEIYGPKNKEASGFTKVFDFLTGSAKKVGDILQNTSDQDIKNILKAGELLVAGGLGYLSYKDQKRFNENLAQVQADYMKRVAEKKEEYGLGTMTVTRGEVNPVRAPAAYGGRMKYALGSVEEGIMAAPQIATMMGMPVGNPRRNQQGVVELDYRDEGGFVPPIGIKEKEDDIPAMLSNNEFVFTAESVKNADPSGRRDPAEGAKVMYKTMKMLENGGMV